MKICGSRNHQFWLAELHLNGVGKNQQLSNLACAAQCPRDLYISGRDQFISAAKIAHSNGEQGPRSFLSLMIVFMPNTKIVIPKSRIFEETFSTVICLVIVVQGFHSYRHALVHLVQIPINVGGFIPIFLLTPDFGDSFFKKSTSPAVSADLINWIPLMDELVCRISDRSPFSSPVACLNG